MPVNSLDEYEKDMYNLCKTKTDCGQPISITRADETIGPTVLHIYVA